MDTKDRKVFGLFAAAVRHQIPDAEIWAYGSRVRGDAGGFSDLDVCVVVPERTDGVWQVVADAAWEVGFDNGIVIVPVTIASESFHNGPLAASGAGKGGVERRRGRVSGERLSELVRLRLDQAEDALEFGRVALGMGNSRMTVNRAYYAMFYAVLALLVTRRLETSKHTGAISLFDREFVLAGVFGKEMSRWFHHAFLLRNECDYAPMPAVSGQMASDMLRDADEFVARVKAFLGQESDS